MLTQFFTDRHAVKRFKMFSLSTENWSQVMNSSLFSWHVDKIEGHNEMNIITGFLFLTVKFTGRVYSYGLCTFFLSRWNFKKINLISYVVKRLISFSLSFWILMTNSENLSQIHLLH